MAHLTIELDGQHVTSRPLQTTLDLGRSSQCGLSFASSFLSRRHLRLEQAPEGWRAIDLGSTNGTWIGGSRITDHVLQDGQVIQLGNLALTFHEPASSRDRSLSPKHDDSRSAESGASSGTLADEEIAEILGRPHRDSIDEEFAEPNVLGDKRRLGQSAPVSPAATRVSSPVPPRAPQTKAPSLWEIAMKPTPPSATQSNDRGEKSAETLPESVVDQRNPAKPSLRGRWKDLLVRFDTDIKFKGGVTLGLIALLGLGAFYCLQSNGFARSNEPRLNPAALNSQAQTASPASPANALRDLPV